MPTWPPIHHRQAGHAPLQPRATRMPRAGSLSATQLARSRHDGLPPSPAQLVEKRVEPGHDFAALPAVVLADLIKRRPGSLAGMSVQRRLLDLEQCADFLTAWAATAQENQVTRLPPVPSRGDSAGRHGTKGLRSGRTRSPAPARNGHRHHPRPADRSGSWAAADTTPDRPPQRPSELVGRPTPPGRRPRADAGRRTGSRYPGAGIGTRAPPGTRQVHTRPHTGAP
jgi:hypothetical protein